MNYFVPALILAMTLTVVTSHAEEVDDELSQWPKSSAAYANITAEREFKAADKKLNEVYKQLMSAHFTNISNAEARNLLVEAQREWINFRDKNCKMIGDIAGGVNNWKAAYTMDCKVEQTKKRIKELQSIFSNDTDDGD